MAGYGMSRHPLRMALLESFIQWGGKQSGVNRPFRTQLALVEMDSMDWDSADPADLSALQCSANFLQV
jgi:hypothetical protein